MDLLRRHLSQQGILAHMSLFAVIPKIVTQSDLHTCRSNSLGANTGKRSQEVKFIIQRKIID